MGRRGVDWEGIERDYRLGQLSIRQVAEKSGIAPSSITRRAAKHGWSRDLQEIARATTNAELQRIAQQDATSRAHGDISVAQAVADQNVAIVLAHRGEIGETRSLASELRDEIRQITAVVKKVPVADILSNTLAAGLPPLNTRDLLAALDVGGRIAALDKLSNTMTRLVALERQAYGIDDKKAEKSDSFEELLERAKNYVPPTE